MDEDEVGVTPRGGREGEPCALADEAHIILGVLRLERLLERGEEAGLVEAGRRGDDELRLARDGLVEVPDRADEGDYHDDAEYDGCPLVD